MSNTVLDFDKQLLKEIKSLSLPFNASIGVLLKEDNIAISSLPGGRDIQVFYDGVADKRLPYEIAIKVKNKQALAVETLNKIAQHLEEIANLNSDNGSFDFQSINVASAPFLERQDASGFFVYRTQITADLTVYNRKEDK